MPPRCYNISKHETPLTPPEFHDHVPLPLLWFENSADELTDDESDYDFFENIANFNVPMDLNEDAAREEDWEELNAPEFKVSKEALRNIDFQDTMWLRLDGFYLNDHYPDEDDNEDCIW